MLQRTSRIVILGLLMLFVFAACAELADQTESAMQNERQQVEGGEIEQGRQLLLNYGCGSCHTIPGIPGAHTHVGPPLTDWSRRQYIAGSLPNTTDNLVGWIINPHGIEPDTAMPTLGVNEEEALHMSAYLYSLGN
jgi:cytochrome c2